MIIFVDLWCFHLFNSEILDNVHLGLNLLEIL